MSRDPSLRLEDIIDACERMHSYLIGFDAVGFEHDLKTQDAVIRVFEIIGEAVKSLPEEWTDTEPEVPWRQIAGFRDVLAHAYFAVNASVVWTAALEKVPLLKAACLRLLGRT